MRKVSAIILMVDSNCQREHILPSEKAKAYEMKLEAIRRKAGRPSKENPRQLVGNFETADVVGKESGESGRQVQRFIRLTNLVPELLDMIDENGNVMKTFSDYSDEMPVEFVKISIKAGHPWENRKIKDLTSLPDLLLVLILRGEERIIPNGNTVVLAGDKIVLSALSPEENLGICLTEIPIEKDSKWIGKPLSRIKLGEEKLVLVLKRNEKVVIPNGNTVIRENDVLVISQL